MRRILLALFLITGTAYAEDWTNYPERGVLPFLGLDDTSAPTQVQDGRAQDIQNVLLSISYDARQRYGTSLVVIPSGQLEDQETLDVPDEAFCAVTGLKYAKFSSGTERTVATCSDRFYYLNGTSSWDQVPSPTITAGANNQFVWTVALDNIIGTNDVDPPIQYDGTSVSAVDFSSLSAASQPTATKLITFFKNYLITFNNVENSTEYPTRMRWSNVGTIDTWTDEDFIDINPSSGQEINCVGELYDTLIVGMSDSMYKVSLVGGDGTFQISKISDDIGCIAKNSMQSITLKNIQSGLVFLDKEKKIYFYNGVIPQDITRLLTTTMAGLSGSRLQYAVSSDTGTDYWLCLTNGTGSENNLCLDYQYEIGEWTKHVGIDANAMADVIDNNSNDTSFYGSYDSFIYKVQDTSKRDDVNSFSGTVAEVGVINTETASGLQVVYNSAWSLTAGALAGAPIELTGGTGQGLTAVIADNTTTGIIVTSAFSTTPSTDTTVEVGAIDSFYTTKWYDFLDPSRLKHFGEVYFWAEADTSSTHALSYATDFSTTIDTLSLAMTSSTSDAIWGSAIWGVSLWGDVDDIFRIGKLTGSGRYLRIKWAEDDPGETFHVYGSNILYRRGEIF